VQASRLLTETNAAVKDKTQLYSYPAKWYTFCMKTTLDLPDEIVREMKLRALMQGRTLRDLATEFLSQGLGLAAPRQASVPTQDAPFELSADGIPIFRGRSDAPAAHMTLEQLLQLEQDALYSEDMQRAGISV
jgi:hypothetical protein